MSLHMGATCYIRTACSDGRMDPFLEVNVGTMCWKHISQRIREMCVGVGSAARCHFERLERQV